MEMPGWWEERRFGLLFEPSVAAVPGWAPIGTDATAYRAHLGQSGGAPMVEVLAHHRDRWGHVEDFDGFADLLEFDDFDADAWAQLAVDAGAGYAATVARHHDGWRWWASPGTSRTLVEHGPQRDVVGEVADACAARSLAFGVYYSTVADDAVATDGALGVAAREIDDLLARHRPALVLLDGGHGAADASVVAERLVRDVAGLVVDVPLTPGRGRVLGAVTGRDRTTPPAIVDVPWQQRRALGTGHGFNRADGEEQQLGADGIVALLTEVVAKGGHLIVGVGVTGDGDVVEAHADALRGAGAWIRRHRPLVDRGRPWHTWGDLDVRYVVVDGVLHGIDLAGRGRFGALRRGACRVASVRLDGVPVGFHQDDDALRIDSHRSPVGRHDRSSSPPGVTAGVYEIVVTDVDEPVSLFPREVVAPIALAPLVDGSRPGTVVQLGDGVYRGAADVPDGVTVRGLGGGRTRVELDAGEQVSLGARARLEHLAIGTGRHDPFAEPRELVVANGPGGVVLGCAVDGVVAVRADDISVRASHVVGLVADRAQRVGVVRSSVRSSGAFGGAAGVGIAIRGGAGHSIESCEIVGHDRAIQLTDTSGVVVRANELSGHRSAVWLERSDAGRVQANFVKASGRGVDIDGGSGTVVDGNAVCDGDSGCVVRSGATDTLVTGNTWERCRIGVLTWEVGEVSVVANESIDLAETDLVTGP